MSCHQCAVDQSVCHLSVYSCYKNYHHGYAHRFDLILLLTLLRFCPSAIPQMSDIHIRIRLPALKEEKKNFFDDDQG